MHFVCGRELYNAVTRYTGGDPEGRWWSEEGGGVGKLEVSILKVQERYKHVPFYFWPPKVQVGYTENKKLVALSHLGSKN